MTTRPWKFTNITFPCYMVGREEVCTDEYIQIDYVKVFSVPEPALLPILGLILLILCSLMVRRKLYRQVRYTRLSTR